MLSCRGSGTTITLMQSVKYTKRSFIFHMGKNLPFELLKHIKAATSLFETTHEGAFTVACTLCQNRLDQKLV